MLKYFYCKKTGGLIECEQCLKKCVDNVRCFAFPYLNYIFKTSDRPYKGKISSTTALNGNRMNYLKLTQEYTVKPSKQIYTVIGSEGHSMLDGMEGDKGISEQYFEDEHSYGTLDYYDIETGILYDYKFCGSYIVSKTLGLDCRLVQSETEFYGKKTTINKGKDNEQTFVKGDPKMVKEYFVNPAAADVFNYAMQSNRYRIFLEENNMPVNKMVIQLMPKDFSAKNSAKYGLKNPPFMSEMPKYDDDYVLEFYKNKNLELKNALDKKEIPPMCNESENWNGRRCREWCEVSHFCPNNPHIEGCKFNSDEWCWEETKDEK